MKLATPLAPEAVSPERTAVPSFPRPLSGVSDSIGDCGRTSFETGLTST